MSAAEAMQAQARKVGLCGELSEDGQWMCAKPPGHTDPHGDERWSKDSDWDRVEFWCSKTAGRAIYGPVVDRLREREELMAALARDLDARREAAEDVLRKLRQWDVLDVTADGPYWKGVIDGVLEEK